MGLSNSLIAFSVYPILKISCHWSLSSKAVWTRQPFPAHSVMKLIFADISGHKIRNSAWQKKKEDNFAGGRKRQGHRQKGSGHAQGRLKGSVKHSSVPEWYLLANHMWGSSFCCTKNWPRSWPLQYVPGLPNANEKSISHHVVLSFKR